MLPAGDPGSHPALHLAAAALGPPERQRKAARPACGVARPGPHRRPGPGRTRGRGGRGPARRPRAAPSACACDAHPRRRAPPGGPPHLQWGCAGQALSRAPQQPQYRCQGKPAAGRNGLQGECRTHGGSAHPRKAGLSPPRQLTRHKARLRAQPLHHHPPALHLVLRGQQKGGQRSRRRGPCKQRPSAGRPRAQARRPALAGQQCPPAGPTPHRLLKSPHAHPPIHPPTHPSTHPPTHPPTHSSPAAPRTDGAPVSCTTQAEGGGSRPRRRQSPSAA